MVGYKSRLPTQDSKPLKDLSIRKNLLFKIDGILYVKSGSAVGIINKKLSLITNGWQVEKFSNSIQWGSSVQIKRPIDWPTMHYDHNVL